MTHLIRLFVFVLIAAAPAGPARAVTQSVCACAEGDFEGRWNRADAVFAGTVKDIEIVEKFAKMHEADPPVRVTLSVDEAYKGVNDAKTFTLHTSLTHYTCTGYPFVRGKQYLVFAYKRHDYSFEPRSLYRFPGGTYDTGGSCGGTKGFDKTATADLKEITARLPVQEKSLLRQFFTPE